MEDVVGYSVKRSTEVMMLDLLESEERKILCVGCEARMYMNKVKAMVDV